MTTTIIAPALSAKAQSFVDAVGGGLNVVHVGWKSDVKPAAAHKGSVLTKVTTATVMTGVIYADLAVNAGVQTGELPWGEWIAAPYVVGHKGGEYARLNVVPGTIATDYFVNGAMVSYADFAALLTPSARDAKAPKGGTITVKMENLTIL